MALEGAIDAIQEIISEDPGKRGIGPLVVQHDLYRAVCDIWKASCVGILVGFQCNMMYDPPTETDGPVGAISMAKTLTGLGKTVKIVTDPANKKVIEVSITSSSWPAGFQPELVVFEVKPIEEISPEFEVFLDSVDYLISIERCGRSSDGNYYTMSAKNMNHLHSPIDHLFRLAEGREMRTTGIGDGGNEVGMGKVYDLVKSHIILGEKIGCIQSCDTLVVCGVSNWGGFAISAGLRLYSQMMAASHPSESESDSTMKNLVFSAEEHENLMKAVVEAGARDGITGKNELFVDGLDMETHQEKLAAINSIGISP